jgi:alanyl-tRNA synthetase
MEGKQNNFETELFQPIIKEISREMGGQRPFEKRSLSPLFYAIADHIRAVVFSIYDGIMPSNEGRGYVVRKIIRKSILHLKALGIEKPFLNKLTFVVAEVMQKPYPDLKDKQEAVALVVLNEENNFINTLSSTALLFKDKFSGFINNADKVKAGRIAFELYDTYGIPLDLTREWLTTEGISFSEEVFNEELNLQKERSRAKSTMKGDVFDAKSLGLKLKETKFLGYKEYCTEARIEAVLNKGKEVTQGVAGEELEIILDQSCFYPESGGQVGDTGELVNGGSIFEVTDTQKIDNLILHIGRVKSGSFKKGAVLTAKINAKRRLSISRNHTATHILQAALRKVLGAHIQQQGSLVSEEKFRFDFTHFKGLSKEELKMVEDVANEYAGAGHRVEVKEMCLKEARKTKALAFFEEKYGENVRVVSVGDISMEFCGGAHLENTEGIQLIKIIQEGSVASGIRRIEGVTADYAKKFIEEENLKMDQENKKKQELAFSKKREKEEGVKVNKALQELAPKIADKLIKINDINLIAWQGDGLDMNALRRLMDLVKEKAASSVIVLGSKEKERAFLVIGVTGDLLTQGVDALFLIKKSAPIIGGSGGGRKDFAQAGGGKPENFALAFEELKGIIKNLKREDK